MIEVSEAFLKLYDKQAIEITRLREINRKLVEACEIIPPHRLRSLADWLDMIDARDGKRSNGVQIDLRTMARGLKAAIAAATEQP